MDREPPNRQISLGLFVLLILICFHTASEVVASPGPASPFTLQVKVFNKHNSGLPQNLVDVILPDQDGGLWVGTWRGLARLHQGQWRVFTKENGLPHNHVLALALSQDGSLWVGTYNGLARYAPATDTWEVFTKADSGLPGNEIVSLAAAPDGALWVGTGSPGVAEMPEKWIPESCRVSLLDKGKWTVFNPHKDLGFSYVADNYVYAMPGGTVWVMNNGGCLARYQEGRWQTVVNAVVDNRADTRKRLIPTDEFAGLTKEIKCILPMADGTIWLGTEGAGLALFQQGRLEIFTTDNSPLPGNRISYLTSTPDGALWVWTDKGIGLLHQSQWQVFSQEASGVPRDVNYRTMVAGPDGSVWVGTTDSGLVRLSLAPWQVYTKENSGLPTNEVRPLAFSPDGALWVGTYKNGLACFHRGKWQVFTKESGSLPDNEVNGLAVTTDGALWAKTGTGLSRFHQGVSRHFTKADASPLAFRTVHLGATPDGALWVGSDRDLAKYQDGQWQVMTPESTGLPSTGVQGLTVGKQGDLWVLGRKWPRLPPYIPGQPYTPGPMRPSVFVGRLHQGQWQVLPWKLEDAEQLASGFAIRRITATATGDVWIGNFNDALLRFSKGKMERFGPENSGVPHRFIYDVETAPDDALWVATAKGLARYQGGLWQTFTPIISGMPDTYYVSLAVAPDGAVWAGTNDGGLVRFQPPTVRPCLLDLIPAPKSQGEGLIFSGTDQTFAARAFDPAYHTEPQMFRYLWAVRKKGQEVAVLSEQSETPFFTAKFEDGQDYTLEVRALDRFGYQSEPQTRRFRIALPQPPPQWYQLLKIGGFSTVLFSLAYLFFLPPLILLYTRSSLARTALNSGVFNKFPLIHQTILNSAWARRRLFQAGAHKYLRDLTLPSPYIPQAVYRADDKEAQPLHLQEVDDFLCRLCTPGPHALLLGRSGTGKSVLLRGLLHQALERFLSGATGELPLLMDLRTQPLAGRRMEDLIADELKGHGLKDMPEEVLRFWLRKGGFLLLIDSLNEVDSKVIKSELQAFLNRDFHNRIVMASQLDLLKRRDVQVFHLAEVSTAQARDYLREVVGADLWERLPGEVQGLARNPQDLTLLGEVLKDTAPEEVPTNRAELYRNLLRLDTALAPWVETDSPEIRAIYELAFRMVDEVRRTLREDELTAWVRSILEARQAGQAERVAAVVQALERSRMFRQERERHLGLTHAVIGFTHELVGKFLASRHLKALLSDPAAPAWEAAVQLTDEPRWLEVCFFALDELEGRLRLNRFLQDLLQAGGPLRLRLVAYALNTKASEVVSPEIHEAYGRAKMAEDLRETPAPVPLGGMESTISSGPLQ